MGSLSKRARDRLPDSAFAYIDSAGRRLLPIHDPAHVRNALARFGRVDFEDEAARDRARLRLLKAARRHGVAPIGFIAGQLEPHRRLPTGNVTFLLCDIEASTALLRALGERFPQMRSEVRRLVRAAVRRSGGHEVDTRADEYFAAFGDAPSAFAAAIAIQRELGARRWAPDMPTRVRIGVHSGRPTLTPSGYVGLAVHTVARLCAIGHGGQILASAATAQSIGQPEGFDWLALGEHRLAGLAEPIEVVQVAADGLGRDFPALRGL